VPQVPQPVARIIARRPRQCAADTPYRTPGPASKPGTAGSATGSAGPDAPLVGDHGVDNLVEVKSATEADGRRHLREIRHPAGNVVEVLAVDLLVGHQLNPAAAADPGHDPLRQGADADLLVTAQVEDLAEGGGSL